MAGDEVLWNGERGAGGISWADRRRLGLLRGVIDAADQSGRRNAYMHALHTQVLQRELRRTAPLQRALDYGCGTGRFFETLRQFCAVVYGVDREPAMIDAARADGYAFADYIECSQNGEIPFATGTIDFVLCSSVLCVTAARLVRPALREMNRTMRAGATLLILEQVSRLRGLTLRRYYDALYDAGFEPVRTHPIRSANSLFTNVMARHHWIPQRAYPAFARIELALCNGTMHTAKRDPYIEYAIVARRR